MNISKQNKKLYVDLKKGFVNKKQTATQIKEATRAVKESLLPKRRKNSENTSADNYKKMLDSATNNFDKKLSSMSRQYNSILQEKLGESTDKINSLTKEIDRGNKRFFNYSKNNEKLFNGLAKNVQTLAKQKAEANRTAAQPNTSTTVPTNVENPNTTQERLNTAIPNEATYKPTNYVETVEAQVPVMDRHNFTFSSLPLRVFNRNATSLKLNDYLNFGEYQIKFTNAFGLREGENAVTGIPEGTHSKGIDIRLYRGNTPVDVPISLADGTIVKIALDGSGKTVLNSEDRAGGYLIYVQLDENPNKIVKYMHLPKAIMDFKDILLGKKVKRGDLFVNSAGMSGNGTANHVKVSIGSYNPNTGESAMDHSKKSTILQIYC